MSNVLDKIGDFLAAVEEAGIKFSGKDGDTAVICEDCVAVITKTGDDVGVNFVTQVEKLEGYKVGFTREDYEAYLFMEEAGKDGGN